MAHTCPECGQCCYCNSDFDDCCNDFEEDVTNCVHYLQCENDGEDDYDFLDEGELDAENAV